MKSVDESRYFKENIIAYIGNKRRLLPLVKEAVESSRAARDGRAYPVFLDTFSGSGIVSRLAKSMGFRVIANDWEYYSYVLNKAFVETDARDISDLFGSTGSFELLLDKINNLPDPSPEDQYIARYYAPSHNDIDKADYRKERLFYTRENALVIDRVRNFVESEYFSSPDTTGNGRRIKAGFLLTGMLLYQAATHTNTSGVFKAYHKGFGGHGKDALGRILKKIKLTVPPLIDSEHRAVVFMEDANVLVTSGKTGSADIAYLDPPYNQHQYGSNYHLLNTIARWDRIPAPLEKGKDGALSEKAAIRKDWIETRSSYCYREKAAGSFRQLIENLDAETIIVSYSTDGIIPFDEMKDICASRGNVEAMTNEYTKYRGGRQSSRRVNSNIEFVLVIDTKRKQDREARTRLETLLAKKRVLLSLRRKYNPEKLEKISDISDNGKAVFDICGKKIVFSVSPLLELLPDTDLALLGKAELESLLLLLDSAACATREEELSVITGILEKDEVSEFINKNMLCQLLPGILRKIAHKKTKDSFYFWIGKIILLGNEMPELYAAIKNRVEEVAAIAEKRFNS